MLLVSLKKQIICASIDKIIVTITFAIALILLGTTDSKAILQSNPTTHKEPLNEVGSEWITRIRQIETSGQSMGLNEKISEEDGLTATSKENGIDVHMMLPTEYGAIAILSASGYGNQKKLRDEPNAQKRTTTGNETGIYFTGERGEILAGTKESTEEKYMQGETGFSKVFELIQDWHGGRVG